MSAQPDENPRPASPLVGSRWVGTRYPHDGDSGTIVWSDGPMNLLVLNDPERAARCNGDPYPIVVATYVLTNEWRMVNPGPAGGAYSDGGDENPPPCFVISPHEPHVVMRTHPVRGRHPRWCPGVVADAVPCTNGDPS